MNTAKPAPAGASYYELTAADRAALLKECGAPHFASGQIDRWVFQRQIIDFEQMTDLAKPVRAALKDRIAIVPGAVTDRRDAADGTVKLLLRLGSNAPAECVAIPTRDRLTFCISSMSGCPVGCLFCASGAKGMQRRLSAGEMLGQYLHLAVDRKAAPTNVVLMGMGEPLLNYEAVVTFLRLLNNPRLANLGARHITVSTIGVPGEIARLADEKLQVELAFSLHHPVEARRRELIPGATQWPLAGVMESLFYYAQQTGRKITFEYCLIADVNDSISCARHTVELARMVRARVNLIPFNPHPGAPFAAPDPAIVHRFQDIMEQSGIPVTIRRSKGADIAAACGQLALRKEGDRAVQKAKYVPPQNRPEHKSPPAGATGRARKADAVVRRKENCPEAMPDKLKSRPLRPPRDARRGFKPGHKTEGVRDRRDDRWPFKGRPGGQNRDRGRR